MNSSVLSWPTWKKKNIPDIYGCRDGIKGWARQTIQPTLIMHGFFFVAEDYDYGFDDTTKLWASQRAEEYLTKQNKSEKDCEFVYFCSRGSNGYMDYRAVYVRFLDINQYETCINCERFSDPVKEKEIIIRGNCYKNGICHPYSHCAEFKKRKIQDEKNNVQ